jgi:hypothetical protein
MDSEITRPLQSSSDDELLRRLAELVSQSRRVEADLVAHIGEVDERRLYARQAFPSMFAYCTEHLHLSEAEAYRRITVARAARQFPALLDRLRDGRLHLSGLARLAPLLTAQNCEALLERATHLTTRQIEHLVAELQPRPDIPATIRRLPGRRRDTHERPETLLVQEPSLLSAPELVARRVEEQPSVALAARQALPTPASPRPAVVQPLAPARYKVQFTASTELRDKLERLRALMRPEVPDGDLAALIERAVTDTLERLEARRFGKALAPRKTLAATDTSRSGRHVPAAVRRAVRERDGERCRFVDEQGRRCSERHRLEFHHRLPFGMGGDHSLVNISLLCRQHNRSFAELDYGRSAIRRHFSREESVARFAVTNRSKETDRRRAG